MSNKQKKLTPQDIEKIVTEQEPEALYFILNQLGWADMDVRNKTVLKLAYSLFIHDYYIVGGRPLPSDPDQLVYEALVWGEGGETEEEEIETIRATAQMADLLEEMELTWAVRLLTNSIKGHKSFDTIWLDHKYVFWLAFEKQSEVPRDPTQLIKGYAEWLKEYLPI